MVKDLFGSLKVFAECCLKLAKKFNTNASIQILDLILSQLTVPNQQLTWLGGHIFLEHMTNTNVINSYLEVKALSVNFMKISWLYNKQTECLPLVQDILLEIAKDKQQIEVVTSNVHFCKVVKSLISTIQNFIHF